MAAQPIPPPPKPKAKLKAVAARQKPRYDSSLDRQAVLAKLTDPRRKYQAARTRFRVHAYRLSSGAAQAALLDAIWCYTIDAWHPKGKSAPEWTTPVLASDFALEAGFSNQTMSEALRDAIKRGLIARKGDQGSEAHSYRLLMENWPQLVSAYESKEKTCGNHDDEGKSRETTVDRDSAYDLHIDSPIRHGRSASISIPASQIDTAQGLTLTLDNRMPGEVLVRSYVSKMGRIKAVITPAKVSEAGQPAEESGAAVIPLPQPAASDHPPKSKPGPAGAAQANPSTPALVGVAPDPAARVDAPAGVAAIRSAALPASEPLAKRKSRELLDVAAESIQECMAELRAPVMLAEAREVAAILHRSNADSPVDIAWFCAFVQQRAARDAKSRKPLTFPVLKLIAQDAARELWPQEAARRAKGGGSAETASEQEERETQERLARRRDLEKRGRR
jgi:hypothetical protein